METVCKRVEEFVPELCEQVRDLIPHNFIANQQAEYLNQLKETHRDNEAIVILDFSENYSVVIQDEIQSHHFYKKQATVHPFCVYYKHNGEKKIQSIIAIAESLEHNINSVYQFIERLVSIFRDKFPSIKKIIFFSDGAASQYKNRKNFYNICQFNKDFGLDAEWHFFATSHGKGPCDGIGGQFKRQATLTSLRRPDNPIDTAKKLFDFALENKESKVLYTYFSKDDYAEIEKKHLRRYDNIKSLKGTQKLHCVLPFDETTVHTKRYSRSHYVDTFNLER